MPRGIRLFRLMYPYTAARFPDGVPGSKNKLLMAFQKTPDFRYIPPAAEEQKKSRSWKAAGQPALSLILPVPHSGGDGGESFGVTCNNRLQSGLCADVQLPDGQQAAAQVISEQQLHGNQHDGFFRPTAALLRMTYVTLFFRRPDTE